jgi:hypothetical protein
MKNSGIIYLDQVVPNRATGYIKWAGGGYINDKVTVKLYYPIMNVLPDRSLKPWKPLCLKNPINDQPGKTETIATDYFSY